MGDLLDELVLDDLLAEDKQDFRLSQMQFRNSEFKGCSNLASHQQVAAGNR